MQGYSAGGGASGAGVNSDLCLANDAGSISTLRHLLRCNEIVMSATFLLLGESGIVR